MINLVRMVGCVLAEIGVRVSLALWDNTVKCVRVSMVNIARCGVD